MGERLGLRWVEYIVWGGALTVFVVKLSGASGAHLWSSYLGGSGEGPCLRRRRHGLLGHVYISGSTDSSGWVSGGWDTSYGGWTDGFVVKLSGESGTHLWSSYLGGSRTDYADGGVATDGSGNVFVSGMTGSSGWVSGGWDTSLAGYTDGFVVKLSGTTGGHLWSSYLGGSNYDYGDVASPRTARANVLRLGIYLCERLGLRWVGHVVWRVD